MPRYILDCPPHEVDMAVKAIKYGLTLMPDDSKVSIVEYVRAGERFKYLVRRTKTGLSATSENKEGE